MREISMNCFYFIFISAGAKRRGERKMTRIGIKCVLVGDTGSGKSALIQTYASGKFPNDSVILRNVISTVSRNLQVDQVEVKLGLWDTTGDKSKERTRPLAYAKADVILLCFSIDKLSALDGIRANWQDEIDEHAPDAALVLVGMKADLRSLGTECIQAQDVQVLLSELGGEGYVEVSAKNMQGVTELFDYIAEIGLNKISSKRRCINCCTVI
jgi:small GTP-binding protein